MKTTYANGDVYSASDVNDITGTINLLGSSVAYTAGKNKIINGDMRVSQRGTSFSNPANFAYLLDRYAIYYDGTGATRTISQQTFTPGTAPATPYEGANFFRYAQTVAGSSNTVNLIYQRIEDVRTLAGTSAVLSVWLKADSARTVTATARQYFGSGGSGDVNTGFTGSASVTTSWQRFTFTISMPSISGKTIGTSSALEIQLALPSGTTPTIDIWGLQLEQGSTATAFQTATGTIQGELAACQRYYYLAASDSSVSIGLGFNYSSTIMGAFLNFPVTMRIKPSLVVTTGTSWYIFDRNGASDFLNSLTINLPSQNGAEIFNNSEISGTAGQAGFLYTGNASSFVAFSAEL
jgi:hypothetical protein